MLLDTNMLELDVTASNVDEVSHPEGKQPLMLNNVKSVGSLKFAVIKKSDACVKKWLWNCTRDSRLAPLVDMLIEKHNAASDALLNMPLVQGSKSGYRLKKDLACKKKIAEGKSDELVEVTLPQADGSGGLFKMKVPLRLEPTCGWLPLHAGAFVWLWQ